MKLCKIKNGDMVYIVVQMDISMKENEKKVIKKDKENGVKE